MSAKILYSLSDEKQNLKKQIGCMNGILQFFDPHHFINNRSIISSPNHRRVPPDESKQQGRTVNTSSKKTKEKHSNGVKEKQVSPIESSRFSISSSTSTTISSSEYDWAPRPENSPFVEPNYKEKRKSWEYRVNQPPSSPYQPNSPSKTSHNFHKKHIRETSPTFESPIKLKPVPRESAIYELRQTDSPRLSALNESFRSICSNHSAPVVTPRKKDSSRLSYDGRETTDTYKSVSKLRDLPRLSLDSKQRTMKDSSCLSKDDLLLQGIKRENSPQEPTSCRTPSNIVAKLMGLEELPLYKPPGLSPRENYESRVVRSPDVVSRSSKERSLHSPRSNTKESRLSMGNKAKLGQEDVESESIKHPRTIYGAIEKQLADLDFQRSGKDLRALKRILESMHREKNKVENRTEYQSSECTSQKSDNSSSIHIIQKQGPTKATPPRIKVNSNRETKPSKVVKESRKEATQIVTTKRSQKLGIVQPIDDTKVSVQKKMINCNTESHHIINKYSRERTPRPIITSKQPESTKKASLKSSARISESRSSGVKQRLSQHQNLAKNTSLLQENKDQSSSIDSTLSSQQQNSNSLMSENKIVYDNKNEEGKRVDVEFELIIAIKEQPSPVSVLDASFHDDEPPSPIRKKPTALKAYETNATYTEAKWKGTSSSYFSNSIKPGFSYETEDYHKVEPTPPILKMSTYQGILSKTKPNYEERNLEKSYVFEILSASGILDSLDCKDDHLIHQSQEVINPKLFYAIEQNKGSNFLPNKRGRLRRRLLFDTVNEILSEKLAQRRLLLKTQSGLLQEILRELDQLKPSFTSHDLENEEDFQETIIEKDLARRSANWTDFSKEIPNLVLDIERLIFKDLIVEFLHDNTEVQVLKHKNK